MSKSTNPNKSRFSFGEKIQSPEVMLKNIRNKHFGEKEKSPLAIFITTIACTFLCYFYHMVYGLGCPDSLTEGLYYYRNADYSTTQARWMLRYINELFGKNVVINSLTVLFYCLMIGISAYIICRIIKRTKPVPQVLLTAMMVSFPVILHHFAFFYMALAYSFSFLAVTVGTAFIRTRKIPGIIAGVICYLMMMGSYQSYIGAISALALVLFVYDILNEKELKKGILNFVFCGVGGIAACLLNSPVSKLMMKIHGVGADERVNAFSIKSAIDNIGFSLQFSYKWFFSYFNNEVLSRNRLYPVIFAVIAVLTVLTVIKCVREKKIARAILTVVSIAVMPMAMNLLLIIMPENGMRDILRYQYVLIFVLLFIFHEYLDTGLVNKILKYPAYIAILFLFITNVITANCTERMYKLVYDHYEQQFLLALNEVYDLEGYTENETRIVVGGAPSYEILKMNNSKIFRYAEQDGGPVFWWNVFGMVSCREHYFKDILGVNPGGLSQGEYLEVVNSEEYQEMSVWPAEGSVKMIDGFAVIKFDEDAPN